MGRPPAGRSGPDDDSQSRAKAWAERSRLDQGLPAKLSDPAVLDQVARLLAITAADRARPTRGSSQDRGRLGAPEG